MSPASFHGNAPGRTTAAAEGQSCRVRSLRGFAHKARPHPPTPVPPSSRVSLATRGVQRLASAQRFAPRLRPSQILVIDRAPVPESLSKVEGANPAVSQQPRPSVTWNLGSPIACAVAPQATTSSGTSPASAFFRQSRKARQPPRQICFLRPRTAQSPVLFRCGPGAQSVRQSPGPRREPNSLRPLLPKPAAGTLALALQSLGPLRAQPFLRPQESLNFPAQRLARRGARTPSVQTPRESGIPTSNPHILRIAADPAF